MRLENLEQLGIDGTGISAKVTAELMVKLKKLRCIVVDRVHRTNAAALYFCATARVSFVEDLDPFQGVYPRGPRPLLLG